jgi:hypothetical protein
MITVACERDIVIIHLGSRQRDLLVTCSEAEKMTHALRKMANQAEASARMGLHALYRGESWECRIDSYDGVVAIRFFPPQQSTTARVPMSVTAARAIADRIEFVRQQAEYKMKFNFGRN